jgi:hypothetical protein
MKSATLMFLLAGCFAVSAANPPFVTSDPNGGWPEDGYYVHNNMWNSRKYDPCTSTLYASSHANWHVLTRMNNNTRDGAVKTYPNVHRDYRNVPIESFDSLTSTFVETSPRVGIYNVAYDIWINGIARRGSTEIMIWTENFKQVPSGKYVQEVTFGERIYKVYKQSSSGYIAFVAKTNFMSGTVNLLDVMKWTMARGWLASTSTVNQICFGVEMVSTDDTDAKFEVSAFSIDAKLKTKPADVSASRRSNGFDFLFDSLLRMGTSVVVATRESNSCQYVVHAEDIRRGELQAFPPLSCQSISGPECGRTLPSSYSKKSKSAGLPVPARS